MMMMIETQRLCKSFGEQVVLDNIDLDVAEGTILALLGPNGAGKTTAVQILSTLIRADSGEVRVAGHDLAHEPDAVRAAIGVTGQFSAVDPLLTGEDNLLLMADLTDCDLSTLDLMDANFHESILVRTNFSKSGLVGAKFIGVKLTDVNLTRTDLRKTTFESCLFLGVDFHYSDLRGLRLDGQTFIGVTFDKAALKEASFQGATLKNVSFLSGSLWSNRAMKSINFDGAMMDKLTYAALKGMAADVSKVTVL